MFRIWIARGLRTMAAWISGPPSDFDLHRARILWGTDDLPPPGWSHP